MIEYHLQIVVKTILNADNINEARTKASTLISKEIKSIGEALQNGEIEVTIR